MPTTTETRTRAPLAATLALAAALALLGGCDGGIFGTGDGSPGPVLPDAAPQATVAPESGVAPGPDSSADSDVVDQTEPPGQLDVDDATEGLSSVERQLTGRTWTLVSFERDDGSTVPVAVDEASSYTLEFRVDVSETGDPSRTFRGDHVCNGISGSYSLEGSVLALGDVIGTDQDCGAAGEEAAVVVARVLLSGSPAMISFDEDGMTLRSAANEALRYRAVRAFGPD